MHYPGTMVSTPRRVSQALLLPAMAVIPMIVWFAQPAHESKVFKLWMSQRVEDAKACSIEPYDMTRQ